jgi:hypothetical protein
VKQVIATQTPGAIESLLAIMTNPEVSPFIFLTEYMQPVKL